MSETFSLLARAGLRATPRRLKILALLMKTHAPLSAEEVHERVSGVDLVTIYRTLQVFTEAKLMKEVRFKDARVRYEFVEGHHHHLVCTDCGAVEELTACDVAPLEKKILQHSRRFKTISEHALEFFGICNKCA